MIECKEYFEFRICQAKNEADRPRAWVFEEVVKWRNHMRKLAP